jgi:hypothetical protein
MHKREGMKTMKKIWLIATTILMLCFSLAHADTNKDTWLPSLITKTPQEGFELALTISRKGVTSVQKDKEILQALRKSYPHNQENLIAISHVIAVNYQTIAAANNYWK